MKRPYLLRYKGETHTRYGETLDEAKQALSNDWGIDIRDIKADFWRDVFPVGLLKWGIGITALAVAYFLAYLIF